MAGLVPAIHDLSRSTKNVDARDKPGHDEFVATIPHSKKAATPATAFLVSDGVRPYAFSNRDSTYSQFTRFSTNALR
jgi:hypothetical protein